MDPELSDLAYRVGEALKQKGLRIATAESCTGGWVAKVLTDIAGSSDWFERGVVTYSNQAKQELLGVRADTLDTWGAVSEQVIREMAAGVQARSGADLGLAISGVAGPGGGTADKPVGLVWLAWASANDTRARQARFTGDREAIRRQAVVAALEGALEMLGGQRTARQPFP